MSVELDRLNNFLAACRKDRITLWPNDGRVTIVVDSLAVGANSVNSNNVAEIFNRPRLQQCVPGLDPDLRPVGNINKQVVGRSLQRSIPAVPAPHRKAEVVADQRANAP